MTLHPYNEHRLRARCAINGEVEVRVCECLLVVDKAPSVEFTCPDCRSVCVQEIGVANLVKLLYINMPTQRRRSA